MYVTVTLLASLSTPPITELTSSDSSASATLSSAATAIVRFSSASALRSTLCSDTVLALNGLPASSLPVTVASNDVSAARSLPATSTDQLPSLSTSAVYSVPLIVIVTVSPAAASPDTLPLTLTVVADSAALIVSSAVIGSTLIPADASVSAGKESFECMFSWRICSSGIGSSVRTFLSCP